MHDQESSDVKKNEGKIKNFLWLMNDDLPFRS